MSGDDFFLNIDRRFAFKPGIRLAPFRSFAEPWPLPQQYSSRPETVFRINPATFQIQILNRTSDILQAAVKRYTEIVLKRSLEEPYHFINNFDKNFEKFNVDDPDKYKSVVPLRNLCVYVAGSDIGYPRLNYNETCKLNHFISYFIYHHRNMYPRFICIAKAQVRPSAETSGWLSG